MELIKKRCVPCEGYSDPLTNEQEEIYKNEINNWELDRKGTHRLEKDFSLLHFRDSISFVNQIADLAEDEGHHPNITILFNLVKIVIYTHAINGLSENDFILAAKMKQRKIFLKSMSTFAV